MLWIYYIWSGTKVARPIKNTINNVSMVLLTALVNLATDTNRLEWLGLFLSDKQTSRDTRFDSPIVNSTNKALSML